MSFANPSDSEIGELFAQTKTIAVVGCSPKPERTSHQIAAKMQSAGFRVIPVHPAGGEILGETVYPNLKAIPADLQIDIVDVFRRSETVAPVAKAAVEIGAKALWLQQGVYNEEAAADAKAGDVICIMDACIAVYYDLLAPRR